MQAAERDLAAVVRGNEDDIGTRVLRHERPPPAWPARRVPPADLRDIARWGTGIAMRSRNRATTGRASAGGRTGRIPTLRRPSPEYLAAAGAWLPSPARCR